MSEEQTESDALKEIRSKFVGKWKLAASENFEEFLREMGAPFIIRKMAPLSKPDLEIGIIDGKVNMTLKTAFMTQVDPINFEEEYENEMMRTKMRITARYEDGKIKQHFEAIDGSKKPMDGTKEIIDGQLVMTMKIGDLTMKRIFARVE